MHGVDGAGAENAPSELRCAGVHRLGQVGGAADAEFIEQIGSGTRDPATLERRPPRRPDGSP